MVPWTSWTLYVIWQRLSQVENVNIKYYMKQNVLHEVYYDRQSSEQNNRKLISLHKNGEDEKNAHGFADF